MVTFINDILKPNFIPVFIKVIDVTVQPDCAHVYLSMYVYVIVKLSYAWDRCYPLY